MGFNESSEREFLHNLASPIGAAVFLTEAILDGMQSRSGVDPDDLLQIRHIYEALEQVKKLLQQRRETFIKREGG